MSTYLKAVSTSSGFLEDCPVDLGRGLTCIIGARGTCKSTLIESIRFAFELEEVRVATLIGEDDDGEPRWPTYGIIKNTLRAGSVRCALETADSSSQQEVTLEREVGGEPRIFVDGVREHTNRDLLRDIEIFSQGDLQRLAEDDNDKLRLALIDRPHRNQVAELNAERQKTAERLRYLGPGLRKIRGQLSTLDHEITQLDAARSQLDSLTKEAPTASPELEAERQSHERRQKMLEAVRGVRGRAGRSCGSSRTCSGASPPNCRVYSISHGGYGKRLARRDGSADGPSCRRWRSHDGGPEGRFGTPGAAHRCSR